MTEAGQYPALYVRGVELFNECEFFEAHDVWEELWAEYSGDDRTFYQGMIQVAVCLHHFCNGNLRGARKLYHSSRKYLEPYRPRRHGLDLERLFDDMRQCCAEFVDDEQVISGVEIDPERIPDLVLDPPPVQ